MPAMLMMGSRGSETRTLQSKLNQAVSPPPGLDVDGIFGQYTDQAVRRFQTQRRILVDGIVGPQTWGELNRLPAGKGGAAPGKSGGASAAVEPTLKVATLAKEIGFWERGVMEQPLGSNSGPKVNQYLASVGCPPGYAWCMAFVYWCYYMASLRLNLPNPAYRNASCTQVHNWAANNGKIVAEPQDGDVFLVRGPGNTYTHTGIVIRAGGRVTTIEGNTNDNGSAEGIGVFYRTRATSNLAFVRLPDVSEESDWWE